MLSICKFKFNTRIYRLANWLSKRPLFVMFRLSWHSYVGLSTRFESQRNVKLRENVALKLKPQNYVSANSGREN